MFRPNELDLRDLADLRLVEWVEHHDVVEPVDDSGQQPIATKVTPASTFYPAETYHPDYYENNPLRYKYYRCNCGRDQRLQELWGAAK